MINRFLLWVRAPLEEFLYDLKWAFSDTYSNTFSMIEYDFCRAIGILKGQIEDKKYFLEWGSNQQKYYFGAIYLQGRNRKMFSFGFWFK